MKESRRGFFRVLGAGAAAGGILAASKGKADELEPVVRTPQYLDCAITCTAWVQESSLVGAPANLKIKRDPHG